VPAARFAELDDDPDIVGVAGGQGGFTELAMNGMAGGIGDGHPALLDLDVRHAIAHAVDRQQLFDRVILGLGRPGVTVSVSPDPSWQPEIPADEQFGFDPDRANQLLDDGGYADTDGDGVREMPDGSQDLRFRYIERSEWENGAAVRELITGWLGDVGIATDVEISDDTQLTDTIGSGNYDLFVWGWVPFVDPDPMLSYFTCDQVTYDVAEIGYNDANWCDSAFDELYGEQNTELDRERRVEIVHEMLRMFHDQGTYVVLFEDANLQAYRTDRFEGWLQQPAETGPVLFSNSSPTYTNLTLVDGAGDGGGSGVAALVTGAVVGAVVVGAVSVMGIRRRGSRDERE
jgi:peptide/nickel transport system substrate-binding protein